MWAVIWVVRVLGLILLAQASALTRSDFRAGFLASNPELEVSERLRTQSSQSKLIFLLWSESSGNFE